MIATVQRFALGPAWLVPVVAAGALLALSAGAASVPMARVAAALLDGVGLEHGLELAAVDRAVVLHLRLPRVLLALTVGAALALSGAAMQAVLRNPLADPSLIGISGGSALAAATVIVLGTRLLPTFASSGLAAWGLPVAASLGALATTAVLLRISTREGRTAVAVMLLAGIAVNALAMSGVGLLSYVASDEELRTLTFWTMGSLGGATWGRVGAAALFVAPPALYCLQLGRRLDAILLGEAEACHLGLNVEQLKRRVVICAATMVGVAVALTGVIGFVGLVVPHLARIWQGPGHRRLLPAVALIGAGLLLLGDVGARTLVAPAELPIGILTAALGAPFFIALLVAARARVES